MVYGESCAWHSFVLSQCGRSELLHKFARARPQHSSLDVEALGIGRASSWCSGEGAFLLSWWRLYIPARHFCLTLAMCAFQLRLQSITIPPGTYFTESSLVSTFSPMHTWTELARRWLLLLPRTISWVLAAFILSPLFSIQLATRWRFCSLSPSLPGLESDAYKWWCHQHID